MTGKCIGFVLIAWIAGCASLMVPRTGERIDLDGVINFRDIGGYAAENGGRVVRGLVYRSDALAEISDADRLRLNDFGVRTIVDLRTWQERDAARDRVPHSAFFLPHLPVGDPTFSPASLIREVATGQMAQREVDARIVEKYRALVSRPPRRLGEFIDILSSRARLPAIVHCSNGRDRTGAAVATLLLALGVPRDQVMADYLRSNEYLAARAEEKLSAVPDSKREKLRPLYAVKPLYLEAFFEEIDKRWKTVDHFLERGLRVDAAAIDRLRKSLVE